MTDKKSGTKKIAIISAIICVVLVLGVVAALILPDIISGNILLSKTRAGIEKSDVVVLFDPSYNQSTLPTTAQTVVRGERAKQLAEDVLRITDGASYRNVERSAVGFWDVSMRFDDGNDSYTVYLREEYIYVAKNNTAYLFDVDKSVKEEYNILYDEVNALIKQAVENAQ